MSNVELATAWIKLVPTLEGAQGKIAEEMAGPTEKASEETGKRSGRRFTAGWKGVAGVVAGAGLATALMGGFNSAVAGADAKATLKASMTLTDAESQRAGDVAGKLYAGAYGEGLGDTTDAVGAVMSSIGGMRDASAADLQDITSKAMNLASAFDVDVSESAQTAGILMKNGLAKNADQAMDQITSAMTRVPKNLRGEVFPIMDEYSKHFSALGIDGDRAMAMIVAGAQNGEIGMDKVGDSLKEFTIRATDMSKSTTDVYKSLGLDAEDMTNKLLKGGPTANKAMGQIVSAIQSIKDPAQQSQAALALFGTPLEDLGTDQIPAFLKMINPANKAIQSTAGAADKFGATLSGAPQNSLKMLGRSFETLFTQVGTFVLPAVQGFTDWIVKNQWLIPVLATAIGVGLVVAFSAWAVSIWATTAALLANPITWIVVGIIALIAALVFLIANWDAVVAWVSQVWGGFMNWIKQVTDGFVAWWNQLWGGFANWIGGIWSGFVGWIQGIWSGFIGWIQGIVGGFVGWWNSTWSAVGKFFTSLWSGFVGWVRGLVTGWIAWNLAIIRGFQAGWNATWSAVGNFFRGIWYGFVGWVRGLVAGWISGTLGLIRGFQAGWNATWSAVGNFIRGIWTGMVDGARNMGANLLGYIRGIPNQIMGFFAGAGSWLLNAGRSIIDGFINGIKGAIGGVKDLLGGLTKMLPDWKGPADVDARILYGAGQLVMGGFQEGLASEFGSIEGTLGKFTAALPAAAKAPVYEPKSGQEARTINNEWNFNELSNPRSTAYQVALIQDGMA